MEEFIGRDLVVMGGDGACGVVGLFLSGSRDVNM